MAECLFCGLDVAEGESCDCDYDDIDIVALDPATGKHSIMDTIQAWKEISGGPR